MFNSVGIVLPYHLWPLNQMNNSKNRERTLSIIKPDAVCKNITGLVNLEFEKNGLRIVAQKMVVVTLAQAASFYAIHKDRPFFNDLIKFMSSGPIIVQILEGDDAVNKNRKIMGATDPLQADKDTIRYKYGESIDKNVVHGSDSLDNAEQEIRFFFSEVEIVG